MGVILMHLSKFALSLAYVFWPAAAGAQTADIDYIVDTMVRLCLAGGRTEAFSGGGSVGADLSLRSQDVRGNLEGEFRVENSKVEGLVEGINSAMSQVAADQADKVRSCLQPLRNRILDIYLPARAWQNAPEPPTDAPTAELLYETGIGKGRFQGWSLTPDWKRLSNGMLVNDGTGPYSRFAPIFAPYQPEAADYAVETEIRVIQDYASSFGVVVRANGKGGYAVGLGGDGIVPQISAI